VSDFFDLKRMANAISRRSVVNSMSAFSLLSLGACATPTRHDDAAAQAIAPTGRLRASINLGNPVLATRDAVTGEVSGVSVDLAHALAGQLGVGIDLIVTDAAGKSVETVRSGNADIGFFAIDPKRSDGLRFSAAYVLIEGAYLVRTDSPLTTNAEVDSPGNRIMVGLGSVYDLFLSREIRFAQIDRAPTSPTVVAEFLARNADVAAGVKQQLEADALRLGGLRLLPGRFMVIEQALAVPAGRGEAAQTRLKAFVEQAKSSGLVAQSLARHQIRGAVVAPAP
jgi:polar amino acid transport system substrate-binding protein